MNGEEILACLANISKAIVAMEEKEGLIHMGRDKPLFAKGSYSFVDGYVVLSPDVFVYCFYGLGLVWSYQLKAGVLILTTELNGVGFRTTTTHKEYVEIFNMVEGNGPR